MKSSKAMDDYLAVERRFGTGQVAPFPSQSKVDSVKDALSEDELSALRSRGDYPALGDYPEGWGPVPDEAPALATATLIRYEWRASTPDTDSLNVLFADGWEFHTTASVALDGLSSDTCILRRVAA